MRKTESKQNKTNLNRNNLKNHKSLTCFHNMNKEDLDSCYKENISELKDLLLDENSLYEAAGEVDLNFYLDWLEDE